MLFTLHSKKQLLFILTFCFPLGIDFLFAQTDTSRFQKIRSNKIVKAAEKEFKITGGLSASSTFYTAYGIENRRPPFYWIVNGNVTFSFNELSVPVTLVLSEQQNRIASQPFNQIGLSPQYKAFRFHAGYRSMTFSDFTLAGTVFLGGGIDYEPKDKPIKISAMYGRLARAITENGSEGYVYGQPSYERWGYGAKVQRLHKGSDYSLMFFRASDKIGTVSDSLANKMAITPQQNLVLGFIINQKLTPKLSFNVDYGLSYFTRNLLAAEEESSQHQYINHLGDFYKSNSSSTVSGAIQSKINYKLSFMQLNLAYRRIAPDYRTLGSSFLNNDFEDITAGANWTMFKNKVNIAVNGGFQRNNLNKEKDTEMLRKIVNISINYSPTQRISIGANYANFNTSTQAKRFTQSVKPGTNLDSLYYLQVNNSASLMANYILGNGSNVTNSINGNFSIQKASDSKQNNSTFYLMSAAHNIAFKSVNFSINTAFNYNINVLVNNQNNSMGPSIGFNKLIFKKKIKISESNAFMVAANTNSSSTTFTNRLGVSTTIFKKHNLGFDFNYLNSQSESAGLQRTFSEIRSSINYGYTF